MGYDYSSSLQYADVIRELRYSGEVESAISKCMEATERYPQNNFFYKILGDIYMQRGDMEKATEAYIEQLKRLHTRPDQFKTFARFYRCLENKVSPDFLRGFRETIAALIRNGEITSDIFEQLFILLGEDLAIDLKLLEFLHDTNDDKNLRRIREVCDAKISENEIYFIKIVIGYRIATTSRLRSRKTDTYFVSVAERAEMFKEALMLIEKIEDYLLNPTGTRTLLRLCRELNDYTFAEKMLTLDAHYISNSDFNIQYELVYYYEFKKNDELLNRTLQRMSSSADKSMPIARTLRNFYLRFNKFDEAAAVSEHLINLEAHAFPPKTRSRKRSRRDDIFRAEMQSFRAEAQLETEQGLWNKLRILVSEQEHNRQMLALRDLLKGFSHELGQPITNIRYSVQLHQMKSKKGIATDSIDELLKLILSQTERIGNMLARFRPIVSSKSNAEWFIVFDRITSIFADLDIRLNPNNIQYSVSGDESVELWGEAIQFDQIFYNLILNSMQAIAAKKSAGLITVIISKNRKNDIKISFYDDGPGIPSDYSKRIFEPFYTTKEPSSDNGGEGLGLYIVWNIVKIFNGSINLNTIYTKGAKFDIVLPSQGGTAYEQNLNNRR